MIERQGAYDRTGEDLAQEKATRPPRLTLIRYLYGLGLLTSAISAIAFAIKGAVPLLVGALFAGLVCWEQLRR